MSKIVLEIGSIPSDSATDTLSIFPKSDKKLYYVDEDGLETSLGDAGPQGPIGPSAVAGEIPSGFATTDTPYTNVGSDWEDIPNMSTTVTTNGSCRLHAICTYVVTQNSSNDQIGLRLVLESPSEVGNEIITQTNSANEQESGGCQIRTSVLPIGTYVIKAQMKTFTGPAGEFLSGSVFTMGLQGAKGETGQDGASLISGTATPDSMTGFDGWWYLKLPEYRMYGPRVAGAWGAGFDLLTPVVPRNYFDFIVGTQPSAPDAGNVRIWLGTLGINVLNEVAQNTRFPNTPTETEVFEVEPQYLLNVYDPSISDYRSVSATTIAPVAVRQRYVAYDEDEFASGSGTGFKLGWGATNSGTGASIQSGTYGVNGTEKAYGVAQLDTGTTSTGRAALYRQDNQIMLGFTKFNMRWRAAIEDLSTVTQRFFVILGFSDSRNTSGVGTDGVYFYYSDDLYGGNWACVTRAAGIETSVDSGVAASTQYVRFEIEVAENGSQALFYIAGNLVATIATNIPTTQGDFTSVVAKIQKSIGTTQRNLSLDYHNLRGIWTGGR